jgi:phthiocerol/phenolphthiocerol synthesis type-I polyketide synthase C
MSDLSDRRASSLVEHFRARFTERPDDRVFRFLVDGEGTPVTMTNTEFDTAARALAATLRSHTERGERALIVCPAGLDYVVSFFACLYAGVIAVPVYPPNPALLQRTLPRLLAIVEDAEPTVLLAPKAITDMADAFVDVAPALGKLTWVTVDAVDPAVADTWAAPSLGPDDVAFLQYTSGSTSRPKGVLVGHGNLLHNLEQINRRVLDVTGVEGEDHMVSWLPPYHDMGLIGGLLAPAFGGFPVTFMSPFSFLKRPLRWLRAASDHGGTFLGGPNFCYELCIAKTTEADRAALDLSRLRVAFSGAEPVRTETLDRFSEAFAPSGFRREVFVPCYGLAEATLCVSTTAPATPPVDRTLNADSLAAHTVEDAAPGDAVSNVVGCGSSIGDQDIAIVDPQTAERLADGRVGEIWVRGPSVAQGYWRRPTETEETFGACLAGTGEGPYLRTGDLGFLDGDELYVTGRIKDLIIIRGRNYYPQDIEKTVESVDSLLRSGCCVAGARERDGEQRLIVVQEVTRTPSEDEARRVIELIRNEVARDHALQVHDVALIGRGSIPKTSSGKLQRRACLDAFAERTLPIVAEWSVDGPGTSA